MWAWLLQLLPSTLDKVSNLSLNDWSNSLRFAVYDKDPRRLYVIDPPPLSPMNEKKIKIKWCIIR